MVNVSYKENDPSSFALNYTYEKEQDDLMWFELVGDNNISKPMQKLTLETFTHTY